MKTLKTIWHSCFKRVVELNPMEGISNLRFGDSQATALKNWGKPNRIENDSTDKIGQSYYYKSYNMELFFVCKKTWLGRSDEDYVLSLITFWKGPVILFGNYPFELEKQKLIKLLEDRGCIYRETEDGNYRFENLNLDFIFSGETLEAIQASSFPVASTGSALEK